MNLKKLLKQLKLNEENISMVLGGLVIVIVGILVVNYFKDKDNKTLPEALTTTNNQIQVGKTHDVTKGETLWSIAEEAYGSGYNWTDIYNANKLKSESLEVGQKLEIPSVTAKKPTTTKPVVKTEVSPKETAKPTATAAAKATVAPTQATTGNTNTSYTVVKGDSLWKIAVKNYNDGYKWSTIAKANKLGRPGVIHPGNVLTLPR